MLLSAIPTLSLIDPLSPNSEAAPGAGDGFAPLMAALLTPADPAVPPRAPGNPPPPTGENRPVALPPNADGADGADGADLPGSPPFTPAAGPMPPAAPSRFALPVVPGMIASPASPEPETRDGPSLAIVQPVATPQRRPGPVPEPHETRFLSYRRVTHDEAEPARGKAGDGPVAPPTDVATPVPIGTAPIDTDPIDTAPIGTDLVDTAPIGTDLVEPIVAAVVPTPPRRPLDQAEAAAAFPDAPVPVPASPEPTAVTTRPMRARTPVPAQPVAEGTPPRPPESILTAAPPTIAAAQAQPYPVERPAAVLVPASTAARPDHAPSADRHRASATSDGTPPLVDAEPGRAAAAPVPPAAPSSAPPPVPIVTPAPPVLAPIAGDDRRWTNPSSLPRVAPTTSPALSSGAPTPPRATPAPIARSAAPASAFAPTGLPPTSPADPGSVLPRSAPSMAASPPPPMPTPPASVSATTPVATAIPTAPGAATALAMPGRFDWPEPTRRTAPPPMPAGPPKIAPAAPDPTREIAIPPVAARPSPLPSAPVILPALHAFGAAIRRALADERQPARPGGVIADPLAPVAGPAPLAPVAATTPATAALDMRAPAWPQAMVDHIEQLRDMADAADTRIRLIPDALGTIDVGVRREGDTVHVHFTAQQAETRALLHDAQPRLAEAAEARGLKLGRTEVDAGTARTGPETSTAGQGQQHRATPPRPLPVRPASARPIAVETDADTRIA